MKKIINYIGTQFGNPRGPVGKICCFCMNIINKPMYYSIASRITGKKYILDIGYGNGYLIDQIYRKTDSKIVGIDISNDMQIAATKRNKQGVKKGDIELSLGDCCDLQFDDKSFEIVTSINTIYFWEDTLQGLKEILRVLDEGGIFYNAVYSKQWLKKTAYTKDIFKFFEREDYIMLGKKAGFSRVSIVDILPGKSFLVIYEK